MEWATAFAVVGSIWAVAWLLVQVMRLVLTPAPAQPSRAEVKQAVDQAIARMRTHEGNA